MDKKLTDSEIKKALECCVGDNDGKNCFDCPLWEIDDCQEQLLLDALGLINRLQVKNERLKANNKTLENVVKNTFIKKAGFDIDPLVEIKAEAYKEFAERLCEDRVSNDPVVIAAKVELKELVGGNNETKTF